MMDVTSKNTQQWHWPDGKRFAFTVFDDTDSATLDNIAGVYDVLGELGIRTTKSVWPIRGSREPQLAGSTCEDPNYLSWLIGLQKRGFEIALHNVTYHSSWREETARGLNRFMEHFGRYPQSMSNHMNCSEAIYWGAQRLTGINRALYTILRHQNTNHFRGHIQNDPFFWGDYCREHIKFVRNFVYNEINTLKACPYMPYHDSARPFVNYWFASSDGTNLRQFNQCISEQNQDRLQQEGGACIMYTHFAAEFQEAGHVNGRFKFLMGRLSTLDGWFVPVSDLLNYMLERKVDPQISSQQRGELERRWLACKIRSSLRVPGRISASLNANGHCKAQKRTVWETCFIAGQSDRNVR